MGTGNCPYCYKEISDRACICPYCQSSIKTTSELSKFIWIIIDNSDPKIPSRDIKWEFRIPYILKIRGSLFSGWSISVKFLCFGFDLITNVSCGKSVKISLKKWYLALTINRGWSFTIGIGIDWIDFMDWKMMRRVRKMTPEQRKEIRNKKYV